MFSITASKHDCVRNPVKMQYNNRNALSGDKIPGWKGDQA